NVSCLALPLPVRQAGWSQRSEVVLCSAAEKHNDLLGDPWRSWRLGGFLMADRSDLLYSFFLLP
ncbi:MAG TPA: hypothetical protein VM658_10420, partial [bacterium]|nr:hypothetical protein [bacterium]